MWKPTDQPQRPSIPVEPSPAPAGATPSEHPAATSRAARFFARVRERNQITLPPNVVERMGLKLGDVVEFSVNSRGVVQLHAAKIVKAGTPEALQEERAAMLDIAEGRYTLIRSREELREHVDKIRRGEVPARAWKAVPEAERADPVVSAEAVPTIHLTEEQRQDVEQLVQAQLSEFFSNFLGQQYRIRKHEEGAAEHG